MGFSGCADPCSSGKRCLRIAGGSQPASSGLCHEREPDQAPGTPDGTPLAAPPAPAFLKLFFATRLATRSPLFAMVASSQLAQRGKQRGHGGHLTPADAPPPQEAARLLLLLLLLPTDGSMVSRGSAPIAGRPTVPTRAAGVAGGPGESGAAEVPGSEAEGAPPTRRRRGCPAPGPGVQAQSEPSS